MVAERDVEVLIALPWFPCSDAFARIWHVCIVGSPPTFLVWYIVPANGGWQCEWEGHTKILRDELAHECSTRHDLHVTEPSKHRCIVFVDVGLTSDASFRHDVGWPDGSFPCLHILGGLQMALQLSP